MMNWKGFGRKRL